MNVFLGGMYPSQPYTSSESIKQVMVTGKSPVSSQIFNQLKPPYAVNVRNRHPGSCSVYSHPMKNTLFRKHRDPFHKPSTILCSKLKDTYISTSAPFAARKIDNYSNLSWRQPTQEPMKQMIPTYDALNDPHLNEYFQRRFCRCHPEMPAVFGPKCRTHRPRPSSAPNLRKIPVAEKEKIPYKITVTTGKKKNSGTNAKVFIHLKGTRSKIPKTRLTKKSPAVSSKAGTNFHFARKSVNIFKIIGAEIGELKSLVIEHSGLRKEDAWFLQEVEVVNTKSGKPCLFVCNQWLSLYHSDGQVSRKLFPQQLASTEYEVVTVTGSVKGAGTDANVYITLYGKSGVTKKLQLKNNSQSCFENDSSSVFYVKANCVGSMTKLRIEHDNTGMAPGWFLERVVITDMKTPKWKYYFPCGQWLSVDEGDRSTFRDLLGSRNPLAVRKANRYKISVYTGDRKGSGTDANVFITLFGEMGDSGVKKLNNSKNNFERNTLDEFVIRCPSLGCLDRVRIGHDNSGFGPGWFLNKVIVDDEDQGRVYEFTCGRWLAQDEDDGQISRELYRKIGSKNAISGDPYIITVCTGNVPQAGTNARVYIILYGEKRMDRSSGKIWLDGGNFERAKSDVFNIDIAGSLSPLSQIDIGHDNSGVGSGWFLENVVVSCPSTGIEQVFPCAKWLATGEGDGLIERTLVEEKDLRKISEKQFTWYVLVYTSDKLGSGTDANVFLMVYGDSGKSDKIRLSSKSDSFEQGAVDNFQVTVTKIGVPYKIRIWHDNSGMCAGWHLDRVEMENKDNGKRYVFQCNRWLAVDEDDHQIVRELAAIGPGRERALPVVTYTVEVHTGNQHGAGTDANVFISIFGDLGDTGERELKESRLHKNKFERGQIDEFTVEAVTLMKLRKIRIGHDGKGVGSGWFLSRVVVRQDGVQESECLFFCDRWLAVDEDDGAIVRELSTAGSQMLNKTTYNVSVTTGNVRGAGTDAKVYLQIFGKLGDTGALWLKNSKTGSNCFEKARTDQFQIEADDIGKIKRIKIGHDNRNLRAGWFLDKLEIDVPSRGEYYLFACHRWLAKDEDDGLTELELEPSLIDKREKKIPYEITVWTGNMKGAGTDANVFLRLYGEKGKTEECFLRSKTDNFEQGMIDKFKVEATDVGKIQKIRIGHDGCGIFSGWFLEKLLIQRYPRIKRQIKKLSKLNRKQSILSQHQDGDVADRITRQKKEVTLPQDDDKEADATEDYWFYASCWFAKGEDDGAIVRELVPTDKKRSPLSGSFEEVEYTVKVHTGDVWGAGTDANVFINIYGEKGDTGERHLEKSDNINKFERSQEDTFSLKAIDLGKLKKVKIRHDNKGGGAAWFLDWIDVINGRMEKSFFFPCQRWLAVNKDDGQIARELVPVNTSLKKKLSKKDLTAVRDEIALETKAFITTYHVKVTTGDVFGAGTDANISIVLYGANDDTGEMQLKSSLHSKNKFERGKTDEFVLEAVNIGELKKIRIGHDNAGGGAAWFLNKVIIDAPSAGKTWTFLCDRWLARDEDDGEIERELYPQELETTEYVPCIPYEVTTFTSNTTGASTSADVYIVLYGKLNSTRKKSLCSTVKERKERFKRGTADKFIVELEDVGDVITKIRIGHDGSGLGAGWHLEKVDVRKLRRFGKGSVTFSFHCNRWLARDEGDGAIERELVAEKIMKEVVDKDGKLRTKGVVISEQLSNKKYSVRVYTGDKKGAGTDANVFITIFGETGDTGERKLRDSDTHLDKFERNQEDVFSLEACDLGKLCKVNIRHDNSMISPAWYLDRIEIVDILEEDNYVFHCERWLAKNKDDGKIERTLYIEGYDGDLSSTGTLTSRAASRHGSVSSLDSLKFASSTSRRTSLKRAQLSASLEELPEGPTIPYTIRISTGPDTDNGTDSNVWIRIYGVNHLHIGRLLLELAEKNRFEPGSTETFSLDAADVVEVKKVELGHDGKVPGSGWFVKSLEIDLPTKGKHYYFLCNKWLAVDKDDGKTSRTFFVEDGESSTLSYKPLVPYEMKVYTGDVHEAGTDSKITITVFGAEGSTKPIDLEKWDDRFERNKLDVIKVELDDIAPLKKIRIGIDASGSRPHWFLDKIVLQNLNTGVFSFFLCNKWFSRQKGEGWLVHEVPATESGKPVISYTQYKIETKTSDENGAGTGANVYVMFFGANGDSGELHLKDSMGSKNPFERNQLDIFKFDSMLNVGRLSKLRVWHDNKGFGSSWHLDYINVTDEETGQIYNFHCNKWLSNSMDDQQIVRELTCSKSVSPRHLSREKENTEYLVDVTTTDKRDGGTTHHGWLMLEGEHRTSRELKMINKEQSRIFQRGGTDSFKFTTPYLGKLQSCILGAFERDGRPVKNPELRKSMWHCHELVVTDSSTGCRYVFSCNSWIPICKRISKKDGRQLELKKIEESHVSTVQKLAVVQYEINVYTGNVKNAGTNANVFITIYGVHGDTGKRALKQRFRNLFEKDQLDTFKIEAIDLGELSKVHIEHDNSGFHPGWFLDRVEVTNLSTNRTTVFLGQQWFDKEKGDKKIGRDLFTHK